MSLGNNPVKFIQVLMRLESGGKISVEQGQAVNRHIEYLENEVSDLKEHCDTFCKCPSHGPSLIQIPLGE